MRSSAKRVDLCIWGFNYRDARSLMPAGELDPKVRDEVVTFLRRWLPEDAKQIYREMIAEDPQHWSKHPHFHSGFVCTHLLRGNGFTERVLGVTSLDPYWPDILAHAVTLEAPPRVAEPKSAMGE